MNNPLLPLLLLVPTIGALIGAFISGGRAARVWGLLVSLATAGIAVGMAAQFDFGQRISDSGDRIALMDQTVQLKYGFDDANPMALPEIGFALKLGVDSIGLWLVLLTVLLTPLAILASWGSIKEREKEYYAWMNALLAAMLGVFIARDLLLFYVFFELTLVPMFFIIGIWGGPERRAAAGKFFLFTFAGSVFTLAGVIYLGVAARSFDLLEVTRYAQTTLGDGEKFWIFLAFLAGFAVKVPIFPVHTWLPLAHTEAPTAGSVILAGVLLKLGTFGLLRLALPIGLLDASGNLVFPGLVVFLAVLSIIGIIYGALVAWVQQDIKKLVAYSSVSHLGFCVLGLVALNRIGVQGSVLYMINHGLSTGALFLVIGMIYDRHHTRDINALSGLAKTMPRLAFFFILFSMSSIGLPGLNGFVSEFLTVLSAFTSNHLGIAYGFAAATGVVLGAIYMLHMCARIIWGPLKTPGGDHHGHGTSGVGAHGGSHGTLPPDIGIREITVLVPLAIVVVVLGVLPNIVLKTIEGPSALVTSRETVTVEDLAAKSPALQVSLND